MPHGPIDQTAVAEYHERGFHLARGFFTADEIAMLRTAAKEDRELDKHAFGRGDGEGGSVRLSLWNHPGDTLYGMVARCESVVKSAEAILAGEVYHYHSKMIMKDAKVGGAWAWHDHRAHWMSPDPPADATPGTPIQSNTVPLVDIGTPVTVTG